GRVGPAGGERNLDRPARGPRRLFDTNGAAQHDQVRDRDIGAGRRLDVLIDLEDPGQFVRLIDLPVLLGGQTDTSAVGAAAVVRATIGRRRGPGGSHQIGDGQV